MLHMTEHPEIIVTSILNSTFSPSVLGSLHKLLSGGIKIFYCHFASPKWLRLSPALWIALQHSIQSKEKFSALVLEMLSCCAIITRSFLEVRELLWRDLPSY